MRLALPMIGSRLAQYEVVAHLGSGGMGEVYAARDTKLGRSVALKFLPEMFAHDEERLARFQREARLLASLNHPNIAIIYGLDEVSARCFLVMELIEGETLAARLTRGPVALDEALRIARQIADALDAAHQRGIVHRDLKPANIKMAGGGVVKVLDFGIAIAQLPTSGTGDTATLSPTETGVVLGTAAYMSPQQARGEAIDKRSDIWSFGCVLYELLTGRQAFGGRTSSDAIAAVLRGEPDWTAIPPSTPPFVRRVLRRCLTRDPAQRARDIGDMRADLDEAVDQASAGQGSTRPHARELVAWAMTVLLTVSLLALLIPGTIVETPDVAVVRTAIELPPDQRLGLGARAHPLAISPDGRRLAYVGEIDGRAQLYVRELSDVTPRAIPGTNGAAQPFFSPDGESIGFFADGALQRVSVSGGAPFRICNVETTSVGGSWAADGIIVFAAAGAPLSRVSATGGTPEAIAGSDNGIWPQVLPGGRTILFTAEPRESFAVIPITGGRARTIARTTDAQVEGPPILGTGGVHPARYVSGGYLLYGQDPGYVRAVPFDLAALAVTGSPVSLVENVERGSGGGAVFFAASDAGQLVYASSGSRHQLVWVDRIGAETPIAREPAAFRGPQLSPEGTHLAVAINDQTRRSDIWIYDNRGTRRRVTTEGHNLAAAWRPGEGLTFSGGTGAGSEIREYDLNTGQLPLLHERFTHAAYPNSWSPDGELLLFQTSRSTGIDLWVLRRSKRTAQPLLERPFNDGDGQFSPDGQFVAFVSDESGRDEVFVVRYPQLDRKILVSTAGGTSPRWARDGAELFYRQGDALMAAVVTRVDEELRFGEPQRLFSGPYTGVGQNSAFDVTPDGQRFVMVKSEAGTLRRLMLVQNWIAEFQRRGGLAAP